MTSGDSVEISVVVPAYRESLRIAGTAAEVVSYFEEYGAACEVIVADDGSDDATAEEVERASAGDSRISLVRLPVHKGKGAAVRAGVLASRGSVVLLVDADLAIPLSEYPAFAEALRSGADIAVASKELGRRAGLVSQPLKRVLMGRVFNAVVRLLLLPGVLDTQAGFKLIGGDAARLLAGKCEVDGFAYDVEMLALARLEGLRCVELPVHCRLTGRTSVRVISDSVEMLKSIFAVRRRIRLMKKAGKASNG